MGGNEVKEEATESIPLVGERNEVFNIERPLLTTEDEENDALSSENRENNVKSLLTINLENKTVFPEDDKAMKSENFTLKDGANQAESSGNHEEVQENVK